MMKQTKNEAFGFNSPATIHQERDAADLVEAPRKSKPKCPFRNFLNRVNQLDFKGGGLIRGGVADVDA